MKCTLLLVVLLTLAWSGDVFSQQVFGFIQAQADSNLSLRKGRVGLNGPEKDGVFGLRTHYEIYFDFNVPLREWEKIPRLQAKASA